MIDKLFKFFDQHFIESSPTFEQFDERDLQFATIALLLEVMYTDDICTAEERSATLTAICEKFSLSQEQANELINEAEDQRHLATDYFQFTRLINKGFTPEQKVKLIEHLWAVAFADGVLDHHEEHLIRKVSELLHVAHMDFLKTKFKVKNTTAGL